MGLGRGTSFTQLLGPASNQPQVGQFIFQRHGRFWTHKTHHSPDSGEAITFPHIVYFAPLHKGHIQMTFFVSGLPSGSPEIATTRILATLRAHNFLCRPSIVMRSKAKLQPLLRAFQRYVARRLHARKSGQFPTFSGRSQNANLTPGLSFDHNLCCKYPNGS